MLTVTTLSPVLRRVPYRRDPVDQYCRLADLPAPVLLDSGGAGRWDIVAAAPVDDGSLTLGPSPGEAAARAFFADLDARHAARPAAAPAELPFVGGFIGFVGYDAALGLHGLRSRSGVGSTASAQVRDYAWAVLQDHRRGEAWLAARPGTPEGSLADIERRLRGGSAPRPAPFGLDGSFATNLDAAAYARRFRRVRDYIDGGDCYQVNLAQRFSATCSGDPLRAYERLRGLGRAPFSAFLPLGDGAALLSLSPERFLAVAGRRVTTQPIKGTRPRAADPAQDRRVAEALKASIKDRAENLMIVDLLRNDLGRSCRPGTIRVDELFALQSFPEVHHLVSTVSGELAADRSAVTLLRDAFPGGSITGAPKRRAMAIIDELEPHPRQAYCGSVFYLDDAGRMDSNILIRSFLAEGDRIHCWAGGGLVADSRCAEEYAETFDKVGAYLRCLEEIQ